MNSQWDKPTTVDEAAMRGYDPPRALAAQLRAIATQIETTARLLKAVDDSYPNQWPTVHARAELASAAKRARKLADKVDPNRKKP